MLIWATLAWADNCMVRGILWGVADLAVVTGMESSSFFFSHIWQNDLTNLRHMEWMRTIMEKENLVGNRT